MGIKRSTKWVIGSLISAGVLIVGGGAAYATYYAAGDRALPGTMIGDLNVSGKNQEQLVQFLNQREKKVVLKLSGAGLKPTDANFKDLGLTLDVKATVQRALERTHKVVPYFTAPFSKHQVQPVYKLDETKLYDYVQNLSKGLPDTKVAVEPYVKATEGFTAFEVVPGIPGQGLDPASVRVGAEKIASTLSNVSATVKIGQVKPQFTDEQAEKEKEMAVKIASPNVVLSYGDKTYEVDQAERNSWVLLPALATGQKPKVEEATVLEYLEGYRKKIDKPRHDAIRYIHPDGTELKKEKGNIDGIKLVGLDALAKSITTSLDSGMAFNGKFETEVDKAHYQDKTVDWGAENLPYWASPGEKWIDVNLNGEWLTYYEGAKVVRGPVKVIGGAVDSPTVEGLQTITRKLPSRRMRNWDNNGRLLYDIPGVPWVMYFHEGGYAFHGAPWRNGNMNRSGPYDGSHGCVSLTVEESKILYDWAPIGTHAMIHR